MAQRKFNWGLMGPGLIAQKFADDLKVIEDANLYAVASRSIKRAREFAVRNHVRTAYDSYESLVNDPQVDAVYIASSHNFHFESVMMCLQAGKPVLCEKPLTVNAAETRLLVEIARNNRVFLMEALWTRYLPVFEKIRHWLDQKMIGDIHLLSSTFGIAIPLGKDQRWLNPELAGGTLLDMGIYPIATSQWVLDQMPVSVSAQALVGTTGVDELTAVILKYPNGIISQFSSNFLCNGVNDFFIYGTRGFIRIHADYWAATQATLSIEGQELIVTRPLRSGGFEYQTEEAMRCIRGGLLESPGITHAQTLENMELMDKIRAEIGVKYPFEATK